MELDRRTFLKGFIGTAAVAAVALPALAEAAAKPKPIPIPRKPPAVEPLPDIDLENGILSFSGDIEFYPGDKITISYAHVENEVYEIKAVHREKGEITLGRLHRGDEVRMDRDSLAPYLNHQAHRARAQQDWLVGSQHDASQLSLPPPGPRGRYTWPEPRRRRRR